MCSVCIMCKCEDRSAVPLNYFKQARPADESSLWSQCWRGQARHVPGTLNQQAAGSVWHSYLFKTRWTPPEEWHLKLTSGFHMHIHTKTCIHTYSTHKIPCVPSVELGIFIPLMPVIWAFTSPTKALSNLWIESVLTELKMKALDISKHISSNW